MTKKAHGDELYLDAMLRLQDICERKKLPFHAFMTAATLNALMQLGDERATVDLALLVERHGPVLNWATHVPSGRPTDTPPPPAAPVPPADPEPQSPEPRPQKKPRVLAKHVRLVMDVKAFFTAHPKASWTRCFIEVESSHRTARSFYVTARTAARKLGVKLR